jgi:glycerol uptake facilitator protein
MSWKKLPMYFIGQMVGAMVAALALWALLGASVSANLGAAGTAGYLDPSKISSIWCETYPNSTGAVVPTPVACLAEGLGTFFVVALIFAFTEGANLGKPTSAVQPLFIGFIIAMVICVVGPLTNAGLNPARDLGPRIIGALMGFGGFAFSWQVILVYTVSPIIGGLIGAFATVLVIEPVCKRAKAQEVADAQKGQGEQNIQEVKTKRVGTIM